MLVKHLIRELQKCNPEAEVTTEGCDCTGDSYNLEITPDGMLVEIGRHDAYVRYPDKYDNRTDTPKPL